MFKIKGIRYDMTKKELNSYRLTSLEEPSDEMLSALMKEVAKEAKESTEAVNRKFFQQMRERIREQKKAWEKEYNIKFKNA